MNLWSKTAGWIVRKAVEATFRTDIDPAEWYRRNGFRSIADILGGGSEDRAFSVGALFGGTKIISEDTAKVPCKVHRYTDPPYFRETEEYISHPAYDLLMYQPNPEMTPMMFRESMTASAILGNAYAKIIRGAKGQPTALWPMKPSQTRREKNRFGLSIYVNTENGKPEEISGDDVIHLRGFSFDGMDGANLLHYARRVLRIAIGQEEYADEFFQNDKTPGFVLSTDQKLGPEVVKALKEAFQEEVRRHGTAVFHSGLKPHSYNQTNVEAQLAEQRLMELGNIARFLRIPPMKLGDMSKLTLNNAEQIQKWYEAETLSPWWTRWEQILWLKLIKDKNAFVRHTEHGLLRASFKDQSEGFARLLEKGVYSINEVRAYINLNPVEGGDEHFIQMNMQAVSAAAEALSAGTETDPAADVVTDLTNKVMRFPITRVQ